MPLTLTLADLRAEVQRFMGYGRVTPWGAMNAAFQGDVTSIINRGLRQFYYPPAQPGETSSHQWSFLQYEGNVVFPAPVSPTATCSVVNGLVHFNQNNILDTSYRHTVVRFGGDQKFYEVSTTNGNHEVTLKDTTVNLPLGTKATFYWNRAALANTGVDLQVFFGINSGKKALKNVNPGYIHTVAQLTAVSHTGAPALFAVEPASFDVDGAAGMHLRIYPFPTQATSLLIRQRLSPPSLTLATDIPLGGLAHAETIVVSCLAIAEEFGDTPSSKYRELFQQRLNASILADRSGAYASNLGYNGDNSDNLGKTSPRMVTVTYSPNL